LNAARNTPEIPSESAARRNELEQRVEALLRELAAANRDLDKLSYSVSHDLRAPLRHIAAFSQILRAEHADHLSSAGLEVVDRIVRSAQRMSRMIDGMLELARHSKEAIERREVDMNELVRRELAGVQMDIAELPACAGDRVLLARVWSNLIDNALKFAARSPAPRLAIDGVATEKETSYCVRDNGVGFDMKYADQLFGLFHRLHASSDFEGVGVGLAIAHRIIERHGGRIWADAKVNGGATFCFALPREA
jgi:light-regulated signal transduction histidine kinase (bacteriophytochrome)